MDTHSLFPKDRRVAASDGTPLAYTVLGDGPAVPVVLASGWSCPDAYWAALAPYLAERGHRVVLPDTRGHGASGLPRDPGPRARNLRAEDFTLARVARDLLEVCDDAGIAHAVFVGHSMGVQTILDAFRQARERVRALVAVAGAYENPMRTFAGLPFADALYPLGRVAVQAAPRAALPVYRWLLTRHRFAHWGAVRMRAAAPTIAFEPFRAYLSHLASRDPLILFKLLEGMRTHSAADVLPTIDVPFLILAGSKDWFCPPRIQKRMHELVAGSELVWFDEGHHTLPLDDPDGVCAAVGAFLDRHGLGGEPAEQAS